MEIWMLTPGVLNPHARPEDIVVTRRNWLELLKFPETSIFSLERYHLFEVNTDRAGFSGAAVNPVRREKHPLGSPEDPKLLLRLWLVSVA